MASFFTQIAEAVRTTLLSLSGGPSTVAVRETDVVTARDTYPLTIITMGDEDLDARVDTTGGTSDSDQGTIGVEYPIGVSIYREQLTTPTADDVNQQYIQLAQRALGRARPFSALTTVYEGILVRRAAWERQEFVKGVEVSRFAVIFHNAESRTGF